MGGSKKFRIVLISDQRSFNPKDIDISSINLEFPLDKFLKTQISTLKELSERFTFYNSPIEFIRNINKHLHDIVISFWAGNLSRNRRALVPSICEASNINYVGGDPHAMILGQNKWLSKKYLKLFGFNVPKGVLLKSIEDLPLTEHLNFPLVVKPNFEGGSMGITSKNLINTKQELKKVTSQLFTTFSDHILCEEFCFGDEVSIILFGKSNKITLAEAVLFESKDPNVSLQSMLFSLEIKKRKEVSIKKSVITNSISVKTFNYAKEVFKSLRKIEILRIDGRLKNGNFTAFELTPDIGLYTSSSFYKAFQYNGFSYKEMFQKILNNSVENLEG